MREGQKEGESLSEGERDREIKRERQDKERGEGWRRGTMQRKLVGLGFGSGRSCPSVNLIDSRSDKPGDV